MKIEFSKKASKVVAKLSKPDKRQIKEAILKLPAGNVKPLKNHDSSHKLRVGDWRILFSYIGKDVILIEKVGPRGDVYKK